MILLISQKAPCVSSNDLQQQLAEDKYSFQSRSFQKHPLTGKVQLSMVILVALELSDTALIQVHALQINNFYLHTNWICIFKHRYWTCLASASLCIWQHSNIRSVQLKWKNMSKNPWMGLSNIKSIQSAH